MINVCMATTPSRFVKLKKNISSIINQTAKVDAIYLIINGYENNNIAEQYAEFSRMDSRIHVVLGDNKWKSCNKFIYPLTKLGKDSDFIVVDDDIYYHATALQELIDKHNEFPKDIIVHETNPVRYNPEVGIEYLNAIPIKLGQAGFDKYLTNCCYFPAHCFDGSSILDYDKMMELTDGLHDEVWAWVNSTLNGVRCICLSKTMSFEMDGACINDDGLGKINGLPEKIKEYNSRINRIYGEQLKNVFAKNPTIVKVTSDNFYGVVGFGQHMANTLNGLTDVIFDTSSLNQAHRIFWNNYTRNFNIKRCAFKQSGDKIAILAIAKNEAPYIKEWLDYHRNMGVDKFFIINNDDEDNDTMYNILEAENKAKNDIVQVNIPGAEELKKVGMQEGAYNAVYQQVIKQHSDVKWLAIIDIDEFLYFDGKSAKEYLAQPVFNDTDVIHVNWRLYGDNGQIRYEDKPVQERFPNQCPLNVSYNSDERAKGIYENMFIKSIVRLTDKPIKICAHTTFVQNGITRRSDGTVSTNPWFESISTDNNYVKHYNTKSLEEYIDRRCVSTSTDVAHGVINAKTRLEWYFNENEKTPEKLTYIKERLVIEV